MDKEVILYGVLLLVIVMAIGFGMAKTYDASYGDERFQAALAAQNPNDKCSTPDGYTDEQWREHMGHHPGLYRECLDNTPEE
ncbi:MAG TPA: hypothetical protein VJ110_01725 [Candidatus Nanoarchaeia archaeon]|nr:hypothetical protein [Candidatus Nanoarchaeia archaeon]